MGDGRGLRDGARPLDFLLLLLGLLGVFGVREMLWYLQSWTRSDTLGLVVMLVVLRDAGFVVMMMTGAEEYGEEGRYV